jgi:glutamine cyclotransferase
VALGVIAFGCGDDDTVSDTGSTSSEIASTTTSAPPSEPTTTPPEPTTTAPAREARVEVIEVFPHDPTSFTQGLELIDDTTLLESTGQYGESEISVIDLQTGAASRSMALDADLFGEGATMTDDDHAIQLTWRSGRAFVYDTATLRVVAEHTYEGEGWGLCLDAERLVLSDGSDTLTFREPLKFTSVGSTSVTRDGQPLEGLNELECVDGDVYANVYTTDEIVRIDLDSGEVITTIDASGLLSDDESSNANLLNGIAHDPSDGTFLITGKYWPSLFRVRFV